MMLKIDSAGAPACGHARGRAKSTFFGNRLVVCQITSKNGADYKNDVVAGEQTRAKRGFLRVNFNIISLIYLAGVQKQQISNCISLPPTVSILHSWFTVLEVSISGKKILHY